LAQRIVVVAAWNSERLQQMGYSLVVLEGAAVRRNMVSVNVAIIAAKIGGKKRL
jgi:hypothetical protein